MLRLTAGQWQQHQATAPMGCGSCARTEVQGLRCQVSLMSQASVLEWDYRPTLSERACPPWGHARVRAGMLSREHQAF